MKFLENLMPAENKKKKCVELIFDSKQLRQKIFFEIFDF